MSPVVNVLQSPFTPSHSHLTRTQQQLSRRQRLNLLQQKRKTNKEDKNKLILFCHRKRTEQVMMEKSNSQYDSFLYWRQPIPALDLSELEDLGLTDSLLTNCSSGKEKTSTMLRGQDEEGVLSEFSSFNYWRAPIGDVDALLADLNLLL
ncbi:protein AF1q [Xyrichtys novacula]|uniref:Protein AF1q n=1 Tax=Xyrichtys novacula TaxID=13765 RepID=A0AAV1HIN1_XYRNO|nr:protein AF1q [Xyrichtys novacula]